MIPLKVANDDQFLVMARIASNFFNKSLMPGDIVIHSFRGKGEPLFLFSKDDSFSRPAFTALNIVRNMNVIDGVVFQDECTWLPGLDDMIRLLMTKTGRGGTIIYQSTDIVQEYYLKWLDKNKEYRKGLDGMYCEFLAFTMFMLFKMTWKKDKWVKPTKKKKAKKSPAKALKKTKK